MPVDSAGKPIAVGDPVTFRGQVYTIKKFIPREGFLGTSAIEFEEKQHTPERACETSVDLMLSVREHTIGGL